MFHLAAFFKSSAGGLTDEDTPALSDQVMTISNSHFIPPVPVAIKFVTVNGATAVRVKLSTPKLRAIAQPQFPAASTSASVVTPVNFNDLTKMPLKLNPIDELSALVTTSAGASGNVVGVWLDDGHTTHTVGEPYWIHGQSTFTSTADVWSSGAIVFDQTLPAGQYVVVGMDVFAATTTFARLIFPTGGWRPGVPCRATASSNSLPFFYNGYMGDFGRFASVAQPLLEVFSTTGVSLFDVYLQLIKVA